MRMDIDIWEVINAASTKPFGFTAFYPGPGSGWTLHSDRSVLPFMESQGIRLFTRFIQLAGEINTAMPHYIVERVAGALNGVSKSVRGAKVLILGVAYKKDVDDVRESPALEIMELLQQGRGTLLQRSVYSAASQNAAL